MINPYGKERWGKLWEKLEQEGNVGLEYVINPYLYPAIINELVKKPRALVVDFGAGTNVLGIQFLYGYAPSIPALKDNSLLEVACFNTMLYLGLEGSTELVERSQHYMKDIGAPSNIATVLCELGKEEINLFSNEGVDLCISRQFLMHLSPEAFEVHIQAVSAMLKTDGKYIFSILNPQYEVKKVGEDLKEGERYEFTHGDHGEYGTFYHYFKSQEYFESVITKYFKIESKIECRPITDEFKKTHPRYYAETPMAFVYIISK